jgi:hypothetical protein
VPTAKIAGVSDMPLDMELFFHQFLIETHSSKIILRLKQKDFKFIVYFKKTPKHKYNNFKCIIENLDN